MERKICVLWLCTDAFFLCTYFLLFPQEIGIKVYLGECFSLKFLGAYEKHLSIFWPAEKNIKLILVWVRMKYLDNISSVPHYLHVDLKMGQNHISNFATAWQQVHFFESLSQLVFGLDWICWSIIILPN